MSTARRSAGAWAAVAAGSGVALVGCGNDRTPNSLRPAGKEASTTALTWWLLLAAGGVVAIIVIVAIVWGSLRGRRANPAELGDDKLIALGGVALPAVVLIAVAVLTVWATAETRGSAVAADALTVEVTGHQYWWEVRYPDSGVVTANEITIPEDRPVRLTLRTADVIHSFWVPQLAGKLDMIPGQTNTLDLRATKTGTFWGVCAEFCGAQHAGMGIVVDVLDGPQFDAWIAAGQAVEPVTDPQSVRGQHVFEASACAGCHRIAGISRGDVGPDLTALSERKTIGAGVLDNTPENLAKWITSVQDVKPGAHMLAFHFSDTDLAALVKFLETNR